MFVPDCDDCSSLAVATFASACTSSSSASIDHIMSTSISPKRARFDDPVADVEEEDGKLCRTERMNARKASAASVCAGAHVRSVEHNKV